MLGRLLRGTPFYRGYGEADAVVFAERILSLLSINPLPPIYIDPSYAYAMQMSVANGMPGPMGFDAEAALEHEIAWNLRNPLGSRRTTFGGHAAAWGDLERMGVSSDSTSSFAFVFRLPPGFPDRELLLTYQIPIRDHALFADGYPPHMGGDRPMYADYPVGQPYGQPYEHLLPPHPSGSGHHHHHHHHHHAIASHPHDPSASSSHPSTSRANAKYAQASASYAEQPPEGNHHFHHHHYPPSAAGNSRTAVSHADRASKTSGTRPVSGEPALWPPSASQSLHNQSNGSIALNEASDPRSTSRAIGESLDAVAEQQGARRSLEEPASISATSTPRRHIDKSKAVRPTLDDHMASTSPKPPSRSFEPQGGRQQIVDEPTNASSDLYKGFGRSRGGGGGGGAKPSSAYMPIPNESSADPSGLHQPNFSRYSAGISGNLSPKKTAQRVRGEQR